MILRHSCGFERALPARNHGPEVFAFISHIAKCKARWYNPDDAATHAVHPESLFADDERGQEGIQEIA